MLFKILPDGLVVLFAATEIKWGDVLYDAFYGAIGDGVILNGAFDDGAIQGLDVFPAEGRGFGSPSAGFDDELTVFGTDVFGAPVQPTVFDI